ncbi:MAG: hypothetical protein Q8Q06_01365 [bacterium]|nr:hypothetical protein [bacterium]
MLAILPYIVYAHGLNTFEFNPDESRRFSNATANTVSQKFLPQNDAINGLDLWLDNIDSQGTVSFRLLNSSGAVIASKNITLQTIPAKENGTRFHVDFGSQINLNSNQVYELEIISDLGGLGLYYAVNIDLLQHNAEQGIEYVPGNAIINGVEQGYTFKYAFYEDSDPYPPIISNVTSEIVTSETVRLLFNANEPIDWIVLWGPEGQGYNQSTLYKNLYTTCLPGTEPCSTLLAVQPGRTYNYQIIAEDSWGNISQETGTFQSYQNPNPTTSPSPSATPLEETFSTPPIITDSSVASLTDKSVKITWHTDKASDSDLLISLDQNGQNVITQVQNNTYELVHTLQTTNILQPDTEYFARILSRNPGSAEYRAKNLALIISSGNNDNSSWQVISFRTLPQSPNEPEEPQGESNIETNQTNENGQTTTSIGWSEPSGGEPPGGYRIDIFDKNNILQKQISVPSGTHNATLNDLPSGDYNVIVYGDNGNALEKIGPPAKIKGAEPFLTNLQLFSIAGLLLAAFGLWKFWQKMKNKNKLKGVITPTSYGDTAYQNRV